MVSSDQNRRMDQPEALKPDPLLGDFLSAINPDDSILDWSKVESLVAEAPPAHIPLTARLFGTGRRQLRYALSAASLCVVLLVSVLGILPAQSNAVGTIVYTDLPASWAVDGLEFAELSDAAFARFNTLLLPESTLYLKVKERAGKDQLLFVMLGVPEAEANSYFSSLSHQYPAIEAKPAQYATIDSGRFDSLLHELAVKLTPLAAGDDNALGLRVVESLRDAGFTDINYEIKRVNGKVVIEIDAAPGIELTAGEGQSELRDMGITSELLGDDAYAKLLSELAETGS